MPSLDYACMYHGHKIPFPTRRVAKELKEVCFSLPFSYPYISHFINDSNNLYMLAITNIQWSIIYDVDTLWGN